MSEKQSEQSNNNQEHTEYKVDGFGVKDSSESQEVSDLKNEDDIEEKNLETEKEAILYINGLNSVDKNRVIRNVLTGSSGISSYTILKHREKLGLSIRELIDLSCVNMSTYTLMRNLSQIDPAFHQEIADRTIEDGYSSAVLQDSSQLKQVDIPGIINKIAYFNTDDYRKNGIYKLLEESHYLPEAWLKQIPQGIVQEMICVYPDIVAYRLDKLAGIINIDILTKKLFEFHEFQALIDNKDKLNIDLNDSFAMKVIGSAGDEEILIKNINKFKRLSREVYISLVNLSPEKAYPIMPEFDGITKEEMRVAIQNSVLDALDFDNLITRYVSRIAEEEQQKTETTAASVLYIIFGKDNIETSSLDKIKTIISDLKNLAEELNQKNRIYQTFNDRDYRDPERRKAGNEQYEANQKYHEKLHQIYNLIGIENIIESYGICLPLEELINMSKHNTYGLHDSLKIFTWDEVKQMLTLDVNLSTALELKKAVPRIGHELTIDEISELAKYDCTGLVDAVSVWSVTDIKKIMDSDIPLYDALSINSSIKRNFRESIPVEIICKLFYYLSKKVSLFSDDDDEQTRVPGLAIESLKETIKKGFTLEEIMRFPFLISPLIIKK